MISQTGTLRPPPRASAHRRRRVFAHEVRALCLVALPIVVSQLGNIAMNTTDTLMVGRLGAVALASAGVAASVHFFLITLCQGVVMGMGPLVSQAYGAGKPDDCRHTLVQGLWVAAGLSALAVAVSIAGPSVTRLLGQAPEVAELSGRMLQALAPGIPAVIVFMTFRQYLEGMSVARPAMLITVFGILANVALNYLLIWGVSGWLPAMGAIGSALSTSVARWLMVIAMITVVLLRPQLNPFRQADASVDRVRIRAILSLGGPVAMQLGAEVGFFAFAAVMMGWIGPVQSAAHQVAINAAATAFMVGLGTSVAGSIRVGQHLGAADPRGARRAAVATYVLVVGFMSGCGVVFVSVPRGIISLYTDDPRILAIGAGLLLMAAAFQVFDAAQVAGLQVLRGAADTRIPMWITLVGYWLIGFPAAYLLGFRTRFGHMGIWAGLVIGLAVVALMLAFRVRRVMWRTTA
jgi:multidrug resistance protein, MATE family